MEDKLREFYIDRGKYKGTYPIYEPDEFKKLYPYIKYKRWGREEDLMDIQSGDWIEANDGYITQCLNVVHYVKGNSIFCRFSMCTVANYHNPVNGKSYWGKFLAQPSSIDPNSLSGRPALNDRGLRSSTMKLAFAKLLASGMNFLDAYNAVICKDKVFRYNSLKYTAINRIIKLMGDPIVVKAIQEHKKGYINRLKNDKAFSDENMIKLIKDFMENVRKGSIVHLESIIPLLKLAGKIDE